jgi:hypothetical protein
MSSSIANVILTLMKLEMSSFLLEIDDIFSYEREI